MPDIRTGLGRYCTIHKYTHEDEYLVFFFYKNIEFKETEVDGLDIRGIVE